MAEKSNNQRLIMFSDGVMAVAITLLVLDIRLPVEAGGLDDGELLSAIVRTLPRIYAYALSFVVVGLFWSSHRQKFELIPRVNGVLVWLNVLFLLATGLVPFVTSVLAENHGVTATVLYAGLMAAIGFVLTLIWGYARAGGLINNTLDQRQKATVFWVSVSGWGAFLLSIPVAFVNADAAKFVWLLLAPISIGRAMTHRRIERTLTEG